MRRSRLRYALALAALLGLVTGGIGEAQSPSASAPGALTTAPIDPSVYRDGAIQRFTGRYGEWSFVCDEVVKIGKRFCSLRTTVLRPDGQPFAAITVSTGQDGRPAALVRMAASNVPKAGFEVMPIAVPSTAEPAKATKSGKQKQPEAAQAVSVYRVFPTSCGLDVCQMIWSLPLDHIMALNAKERDGGLQVRIKSDNGQSLLEFKIPADGFAAAVDASTAPGRLGQ